MKAESSSRVFVSTNEAAPPHIQQDLTTARTSNLGEENVYKRNLYKVYLHSTAIAQRETTPYIMY
jgi:hypothetical protein